MTENMLKTNKLTSLSSYSYHWSSDTFNKPSMKQIFLELTFASM